MTTLAPPTSNAATGSRRLPAPPLRQRVLIAAALGSLGTAGVGVALHSWFDTRATQPLVAQAVFTAMMAVAVLTMRHYHPFPNLGAANRVTLLRAVLVALAASLIPEPAESSLAWVVVVLMSIVCALDGIDGWLARRTGMTSAFGARFDMETDAFFMLVLSLVVWRHQKAGVWVVAIGLMRYAFVAAGRVWPWLAQPLRPTRRGKAVAVGQFVGLGVALLPGVPVLASTLACGTALAGLTWSFAVDVRFLYKERARPDAVLS
jgi:phosphatidylglycerophosphate synthase